MKKDRPNLYTNSRAEARRLKETQMHEESFRLNVQCARAVEQAIRDCAGEAYQAPALFGPEHCAGDRHELDYKGKVLVLSLEALRESCWNARNQLWLGVGASAAPPPPADGRSIPPASATGSRRAGTAPISLGRWMSGICRTGRRRSWRSCAGPGWSGTTAPIWAI